MSFNVRRPMTIVAILVALAPTGIASAETPRPLKDRCIEANAHAQPLRRSGDFTGAREQLKMCADAGCPKMVRDDCAARFDELERAQPTMVFEAKTPDGNDLVAVDVNMDGRPWTAKLDGTALPVDPGDHTFTFEVAGQPRVTRQLVVREGEKARHEEIVIGTPKPPVPAAAPLAPPVTPPPLPEARSSMGKPFGVVAGGVGLAAIAVGGVFGWLTKGAVDRQNRDCPSAGSCGDRSAALNDHDAAVRDGFVADVGFIAGGALLAGGTALFLLSGHRSGGSNEDTTGIVVAPSVGPSGAGLSLKGAF